jgi:hypothetical protein
VFAGRSLPQLDLVAARYRNGEEDTTQLTGQSQQAQLKIWTGALIYSLVCFVGFVLLLTPRAGLLSEAADFPRLTYALLWTTERNVIGELAMVVTVAGVAFLGGYVFQLRNLIRVTLNQELSALAFVRATVYLLQGVIVAIVAFRVFGVSLGVDCLEPSTCAAAAGGAAPEPTRSFAVALGVAFLIGYWPDLGLQRIAKGLKVRTKFVDDRAMEISKVIPLEAIEGIDAETAFRLQESNLHDVQNLAAANPLELYAETPYQLLEIFDWVIQAQLLENVGVATFAELKRHGVRTVFDLERAALAEDAPAEYVSALGGILFKHTTPAFRLRFGLPASGEDTGNVDPKVVRHAVAVLLDDLHIHRLRALWRIMREATSGDDGQNWLYPTGPLPGDVPPAAAQPEPPSA